MATTSEEVWALLREMLEAQKETKRLFQDTDRKFQETDRRFQESQAEADRRLRELDRRLGDLGGKWGLFVENQVAPACETIFAARGIPVHMVSQRVKKRQAGDTLEIDVLVVNADHVVVVEVKSSLGVADVRDLVADLGRFRAFFPEYADKRLHGAVAGIVFEEQADTYAYRQGLFVLAQAGETMQILNDEQFQPKAW
ncbi:MAG: DUF3782 domain-containing protein [Gammaproteobacteria bacterium]|nr:DUF3782 domain-containing protein [Gammaproteobacteria bacterium]